MVDAPRAHDSSFERFKSWFSFLVLNVSQDEPVELQVVSNSDAIAVCMSDIHDHCAKLATELRELVDGPTNIDRMRSAVAAIEVQLALAVRNWRELEPLLLAEGLLSEEARVFDELSTFEADGRVD